MKKLLFLLSFLLIGTFAFAQDNQQSYSGTASASENSSTSYAAAFTAHSRDFFVIQFGYSGWNSNSDSLKTKGFSRAFNMALMYDFPISKSNFSFAAGLGISAASDFMDKNINIADSTTNQIRLSANKYNKYKLVTAYLEIPVELRFRAINDMGKKGFNAAVGLKFGTNVDAHAKGKRAINGNKEIEKIKDRQFFQKYRVAATARAGYGAFTIYGTYSLTNMFNANTGVTVNPYSIGICLSGL